MRVDKQFLNMGIMKVIILSTLPRTSSPVDVRNKRLNAPVPLKFPRFLFPVKYLQWSSPLNPILITSRFIDHSEELTSRNRNPI